MWSLSEVITLIPCDQGLTNEIKRSWYFSYISWVEITGSGCFWAPVHLVSSVFLPQLSMQWQSYCPIILKEMLSPLIINLCPTAQRPCLKVSLSLPPPPSRLLDIHTLTQSQSFSCTLQMLWIMKNMIKRTVGLTIRSKHPSCITLPCPKSPTPTGNEEGSALGQQKHQFTTGEMRWIYICLHDAL